MLRPGCWLLTALAVPSLIAQQTPPVQQMAQQAHELAGRLHELQEGEGNGAEHDRQVAAATKAIDDFIEPMLTASLSMEHYVEVGSPLLTVYPAAAVRVSEAGLKRFPDSRFLYDHIGFARLRMTEDLKPGAVWLAELHAAEQAFRKALTLQPETYHAHVGLCQALDILGQEDEALHELEVATKAAAAASQPVPLTPLHRGCMLLRANKPALALAALQSDQLEDESRKAAQVLTLRAHALAGDAAKVAELAKAMAAAGDAGRAALEQADALLWLGKKADALKLLAKKPAGNGSEDDENALLAQSYAALEQFANATDFGPASPLRAALTKALGHAFKAALPDKGGKMRDVDLSASPVMMAYVTAKAPVQPVKQWGNSVLLALCLEAQPGWKPGADETLLGKSVQGVPGPDDLPGVLVAMRFALGNPDEACGLASLRAAGKLQDKAPAKK